MWYRCSTHFHILYRSSLVEMSAKFQVQCLTQSRSPSNIVPEVNIQLTSIRHQKQIVDRSICGSVSANDWDGEGFCGEQSSACQLFSIRTNAETACGKLQVWRCIQYWLRVPDEEHEHFQKCRKHKVLQHGHLRMGINASNFPMPTYLPISRSKAQIRFSTQNAPKCPRRPRHGISRYIK